MKYRRPPTWRQWVMIGAIVVFTVVELWGVFDPGREDTLSEWVWDLPWTAVLAICVGTGVLAAWVIPHFVDGWKDRRRRENR